MITLTIKFLLNLIDVKWARGQGYINRTEEAQVQLLQVAMKYGPNTQVSLFLFNFYRR